MHIGIVKELGDARVALIPDNVQQLIETNNQVSVESGAGAEAFYSDQDFQSAGASIKSRDEVLQASDFIVTINPLINNDLNTLGDGKVLISSFQPFADATVLDGLAERNHTVLSLDMIPRTTLAQAMDVLSSMASIGGYKSILIAADRLPRYFPMLTTAAGTIPPAKVLILGAGVAGLQAAATAKRLGAVVEAFDTRLAAKEEVESLGAKFVMVEGAADDKEAGGYAVEQSEEYKQKQRALIEEKAIKADVIVTTALLRGKKAPILVSKDTVDKMRPGAVIVDLAASGGGNCELTENEKTVTYNEITIIGNSNLAAGMPMHASQLYGKNIWNYIKTFLKDGELTLDWEDQIIDSSCVVLKGEIRYNKN